ncbi:DUF5941 domain-containing protein [Polymorphospora sp. NPDC050346]|uniref:DUF5941 domain-containing protein n=1 Tax=Polymorphospora sp. NPDC050346 TaxID=3155780 RepID=UPI0033D2861A
MAVAGGRRLTTHLLDQLRAAGTREVVSVTSLVHLAELARSAREPVLLVGDDVVAHTAVLRHVATVPGTASVALVLTDEPDAGPRATVIEDRGQVVAAGLEGITRLDGAASDPIGVFGAVLRVGPADLPALAESALAEAGRDEAAEAGPGRAVPPLDRLLTRLTARPTMILAHRARLLVARRVTSQPAADAAVRTVAAVDSDRAELRLAVKERDDLFTTYAVSTWSPYVTRLAARLGLSPTGVTVLSIVFAAGAAALFALGGNRIALVAGALLLYLGFVLDCVDGQLARYTRNFSAWGGWLDTMADRAKEYLVYAGLAVGVERAGLGNGWALAIAAILLQTVRHMTDTWYGALHDEAARRPKPAAAGGLGARLSQASTRVQADTGSVSYWLKRTVVFPIGERWALIALTVALFNPLVSLIAVLVWGGLAAAYTLALRTLRSASMRVPVLSTVDAVLHRDDGLLARPLGRFTARLPVPALPAAVLAGLAALGLLGAAVFGGPARWTVLPVALVVLLAALPSARPHAGALDWLVPAALRAAEYLLVVAVGLVGDVPPPLTFALLFALAMHHYDLTARLEKRAAAPPLHALNLGWDGRVVVLAAGTALGAATTVVGVLAGLLFLIFVLSAVIGWTSTGNRPGRTRGGDIDVIPALATVGRATEERSR